MFKTERYLNEIQTAIDNFYIDFEYEGYFKETGLAYSYAIQEHKILLLNLFESSDDAAVQEAMDKFVYVCVAHDIPYMFVYGELLTISRCLMKSITLEGNCSTLKDLDSYFDRIESQIAIAYFHKFLRKLATKNHLRLSHISNLIEKNLMVHYQRHLEWMIQLIEYIEHQGEECSLPELKHRNCTFGKWLHDVSIPYIVSTSHFKDLARLHQSLHDLASDVVQQCQNTLSSPKHIIHLMQRIDYLSLEIGNEIAILNDMIMIEEYSKDPLTGLLTRRLFEKVMTSQIEIAKATESQCALMMCDLDHFKSINDTYGHLGGDQVIQTFADVLRILLRKSDFIFRFGGEEFIILLPFTSANDARKIAQKICDHVRDHDALFDTVSVPYTVSIGVTSILSDETTYILKEAIERYVAEVDAKLYLAKKNGRNRVE